MKKKNKLTKQYLFSFLADPKWSAFFLTISFYSICLLSINNKILVAFFFGLLIFYLIRRESLSSALILTYITSWIFLTGKTYEYILIDESFTPYANLHGYRVFLTISSQFLLGLLMVFELLKNSKSYLQSIRENYQLVLFIVFVLFSSIFSKFPGISLFLSLDYIYWVSFIFLATKSIQNDKKIIYRIKGTLLAAATFLSVLSIAQYINQGTLGFQIEAMNVYSVPTSNISSSLMTASQFRPFATFTHPSEMGNYILPIAILQLATIFKRPKNRLSKYLNIIILSLLFIAIALSQSRSAWLALAIASVGMGWVIKTYSINKIPKEYFSYIKKIVIGIAPILIFIGLSRIRSTITALSHLTESPTRLIQIKEAIAVILQKPLFGTGLGISPLEMFILNPNGIIRGFPTPVHMIYFHLAIEVGLLAFIFLVIFFAKRIKIIIDIIKDDKNSNKIHNVSALFALVSLLLNGMVQPIFNSTFKLLAVILVLSCIKSEDRKL